MRHRISIQNAAAGKVYEVILETAGPMWQAIWRTVDKDGTPIRGPHGSSVDANGITLLERVKGMLIGEDASIAALEWTYEKPVPPWMEQQPG
jgi:hypothetical protein